MKSICSIIKRFVINQLEYGVKFTEDKILQKQIIKVNFFFYHICYFFIFISTYNLIRNNLYHARNGFFYIFILIIIHTYFRFSKKINHYIYFFAVFLVASVGFVLAHGANNGSGIVAIGIGIISSLNIAGLFVGSILSFVVLFFEVFVYFFNDTFPWIYDYPEILEMLFIRFIGVHLGVYAFTYVTIQQQNKLYKMLKKEKEDKEHLFINIVHDIKTPLTMIHNNIDKCIYEENSIESKEVLKSNIIRMEKNIINILNIDRIEKGLFNIDSSVTNISAIAKEVCNLYFDYASSRGLDLKQDIENDIYVKIDNTSFMEIINNLLDNAVKFTNNGDSIKVSVRKYQGKAILKVIDTGIGVADSEKEKIFTKYYQAHKRFGSYYGLGIGLAFVKKICQAFNGNIYVESSLNCGSTFFVEFPISLEKSNNTLNFKKDLFIPKLSNEPQNKAIVNNSKKILIVDDNNDIRNMLINSLSSLYNIASARNGHEAIELCKNVGHFDLIITDIMMPIMDGEEFVKHLRNKIGDSITPVIFLTAKSGKTNIIDYLSLGAIDFISKPFSLDELLSKINSILNTFNYRDKFFVNNISSILEEYVDKNYNTKSVQQKMNQDPNPERLREFNITKKEEIIIKELWKGLSNKEIAENQNISLSTVKTHVYRIYKKCNINNATTLLKFFYHY